MILGTNGREVVSIENIHNLNQLSWDKKRYANYHFADGTVGLEISYYLNGVECRYKVLCGAWRDVELLRYELDEDTVMLENGSIVGKRG